MTGDSADDIASRYGAAYRPLLTAVAVLASFTMMVSGTIVTVAVPDVMGAFGVGQDKAQLMATAFYIAMTTSQLLNAWLVAAIGHRQAFCLNLALFGAASLVGAAAETFEIVVLARVVQGGAAGLLQTQTMLAIFHAFSPTRRGTAMGFYAAGLVLAIGLGPPFGGLVVETLGWRYIFLAPLPLVGLVLAAGLILMPTGRAASRPTFDWFGYGLLIVALYGVMAGLSDGQRRGWLSDHVVGLFVLSVLAGCGFVMLQLRGGGRLLDFSLFRYRAFLAATIVGFIVGMGNFGTIYAVPVFAQLVQNLTPLDAGLLMLPASLIVVCAMPVIGRLADVMSPRIGVVIGLMLFAFGTLPMAAADANTPFLSVLLFVCVMRLGMSVNLPFVTSTALASLPPEHRDVGGGMLNFYRQLGASVGTAAWVVFLDMRTHFHSEALTATQSSANAASRELLQSVGRILSESGVPVSAHEPGALHYLGQVVYAQASALGFQDGFLVLTAIFLLAMLPAWALGKRHDGG